MCDSCDLKKCYAHMLLDPAHLHATRAARSFHNSTSPDSTSGKEIAWHDLHTMSARDRLSSMQEGNDLFHDIASEYLASVAVKYPVVGPNEERAHSMKTGLV